MTTVALLVGEKQRGESSRAVIACNDYILTGPGRTVRGLHDAYLKTPRDTTPKPPTQSYDTLVKWSSKYNWSERAAIYDNEIQQRKVAEAEAEMQSGLALAYERVKRLKELEAQLRAHVILQIVNDQGKANDVANTAVIQQVRGILDDIAKEVGGRVAKQEVTGAGGTPLYPLADVIRELRMANNGD